MPFPTSLQNDLLAWLLDISVMLLCSYLVSSSCLLFPENLTARHSFDKKNSVSVKEVQCTKVVELICHQRLKTGMVWYSMV